MTHEFLWRTSIYIQYLDIQLDMGHEMKKKRRQQRHGYYGVSMLWMMNAIFSLYHD